MAGQNGAYCFKYVSIWTARFDAVFGQRLSLPKNVTAFFGLTASIAQSTVLSVCQLLHAFGTPYCFVISGDMNLKELSLDSLSNACLPVLDYRFKKFCVI